MSGAASASAKVRPAAVAGTFYPGRADELRQVVDDALSAATAVATTAVAATAVATTAVASTAVASTAVGATEATASSGADAIAPKALIVPHAGYIYSGSVAATAYAHVVPWRDTITRVVVLGPAHRVAVRSMAVSAADQWITPLGSVPIDAELRRRVAAMTTVEVDDRPHGPEHSLEVHVPFLQRTLGATFTMLPIVVGQAAREDVADVLDAVWGGDETLIVVSTDLSHFHDYAEARRRDAVTIDAIVAMVAGGDTDIGPDDACGAYPVRGLLVAARRHGLEIEPVDARNSGDTAGPRDRVVGYASFVLRPPSSGPADTVEPTGDAATRASSQPDGHHLGDADKALLLVVAEGAIRARLEGRRAAELPLDLSWALHQPGAAFVTLRDGDRLLGCIGTIEPNRPLADDVADNALGAAFRDPRLPALTPDEFTRMSVHISVMTPLEPLAVNDYADLRRALRPQVDGLLIEAGAHRATFLPSVWEQLPDPDDFLEHLWKKAGLEPAVWPRRIRVSRYGTIEWGVDGPRLPINPR